jgi:Bifunctional DNA primase/polymerase, N-terminal
MTALDQALALWRRGLSVMPVPRPDGRHDGKKPVMAWRDLQTARATEDTIRSWFVIEQNIAIITGTVSGIVVIDADSPEALRWCTKNLPYTPWQTQTSHGFHLYYRHPGLEVRNKARIETRDGRLAIDCRGDGGYVIAPSSVHASGARYAEAGDWTQPREALPCFWVGWIARRQEPVRTPPTRPSSGNVIDRARKYLAAIPPPIIGGGSDNATLYAACKLVRGFGLGPADAETLLWEWAGGRPGWTRAWIARKVQSAERYGTEPIGALR